MSAVEELARDRSPPGWDIHSAVRPLLREAAGLALFGVALYFAYRYGMSFSQETASPFWFPDSVLLCCLLVTRERRWLFYILLTFPIRIFSDVASDIPLWFLVTTTTIDAVKGVITAVLLRRFLANPMRLENVRQFAVFVLVAVLLIPALAAFAGATARQTLGNDYWVTWDQWFMGDALSHLVITPALFYWVFGVATRFPRPDLRRLTEAWALTVGLLLAGYLAANTTEGSPTLMQTRFYAPIPFLFWAALRFGMFGASGATALLAALMVQAALNQRGVFAGLTPGETAHALQNYLLLRAAPLYLVAVVVEQRWSVERSLRESQERFRTMANAAPTLIWMSGLDKGNEFSNESWLEFTGRTFEQELGEGWANGVHPDDWTRMFGTYSAAFDAHQRFEIEYRHRRYDGEYRWMLTSGVPRHASNGDFLGYIGSALDITDRRLAEDATRALAHAQRLAVMGEFTALIAHEVRQPLSAILLNADAARHLLQRPDPPIGELTEIMSIIREQDLRAEDTIGRIRSFARNRPIEPRSLDINTTVVDVLRLISSDAGRRAVQISSDLAPQLPEVLGDPTQLQQVMVNLIVNAMDAEAALPASARRLLITTRPCDDTSVEVAVKDCGCGIAPDKLPQLFDAFFTTNPNGMGLGLSIARSIVSAHHGRLWAENNIEGGATFHFTIPTASDRAQARALAQ
jgi:PAS domain S-box-containing protein